MCHGQHIFLRSISLLPSGILRSALTFPRAYQLKRCICCFYRACYMCGPSYIFDLSIQSAERSVPAPRYIFTKRGLCRRVCSGGLVYLGRTLAVSALCDRHSALSRPVHVSCVTGLMRPSGGSSSYVRQVGSPKVSDMFSYTYTAL
jgi:hypothetical protein